MLIMENIRLALTSLKANKMRALLTMLGIIIGTSSVIAIMTVGNSVTASVNTSLAGLGASNLTIDVTYKRLDDMPDDYKYPEVKEEDLISPEMIEAYIEAFPDIIKGISYYESVGKGQVSSKTGATDITVTGGTKDYFTANKKTMLAGDLFSINMMKNGGQVCLIADKAAKKIYGDNVDFGSIVGNQVQVAVNNKLYNYTIVGVYENEESPYAALLGGGSSTNLYIPIKTARQQLHVTNIGYFDVIIDASVNAAEFGQKTEKFFERYYTKNKSFKVECFSMSAAMDSINSLMNTITIAISVIAGIALLVGGIGVMNIMLVSITERTREIGTRKALGAPNSSIRVQFIVEAIVICLIGGIIGVALGALMGTVATSLMDAECVVSGKSIALSLGFSMAIGIFFGYYPANKAAKMDPIEALRYE